MEGEKDHETCVADVAHCEDKPPKKSCKEKVQAAVLSLGAACVTAFAPCLRELGEVII